jgi:hypothetical protein
MVNRKKQAMEQQITIANSPKETERIAFLSLGLGVHLKIESFSNEYNFYLNYHFFLKKTFVSFLFISDLFLSTKRY